jgi:hypothetical protein
MDLAPKPACLALQNLTRELNGYRLQRRLDGLPEEDFALLFVNKAGARKIAAWTLARPHVVRLPYGRPEISLEVGPAPQYVAVK